MEDDCNDKTCPKGKILRVKYGYNPNSSSMGSIVFALPAALIAVMAGTGVASGVIMSALMRDKKKNKQEQKTVAAIDADDKTKPNGG